MANNEDGSPPKSEEGPYFVELAEPDLVNPDYARRTADALPPEFKRRLVDGAVGVWRGNLNQVPHLLGEVRAERLRATGLELEAILGIPGIRGRARSSTPWWKPKLDARMRTENALKTDPTLWMDILWFWLHAQFDHVLHAAAALAELGHAVRSGAPCPSAVDLPQRDLEEIVDRVVAKHLLIEAEGRLAVDLVRFGLVRFSAPNVSPEREEASAVPRWERDELVLALELSLEAPLSSPSANEPSVVALTELLNALPVHPAHGRTIRTPTDVATMLTTLSGINTASGMQSSRASDRVQEVCREFARNHELLKSLAKGIRAAHTLPEVAAPTVAEADEEEFAEGRILYRLHRSRERSPKLVDEAKKAALSRLGNLQCAVCGFDFAVVYGELGQGYIEAHHMVALSEIGAEKTTKVSDLTLVCANCHRMLHRRRPWLAMADLKTLLKG